MSHAEQFLNINKAVYADAKYTMLAGQPVGIDPVTLKLVPIWGEGVYPTNPTMVSGIVTPIQLLQIDTNKYMVSGYSGSTFYVIVGTVDAVGVWTWGSAQSFAANGPNNARMSKLDTGAVAVVYQDASNYPTVRALTVSGTTITVGSASTLKSTATSGQVWIDTISTGKFVAVYNDNGTNMFAICGTVSGTTITLGSEVSKAVAGAPQKLIVKKTYTDEFVFGMSTASVDAGAIVGTVSTRTITLGSSFTTLLGTNKSLSALDSNGNDRRFVALFNYRLIAGSYSGTTITLGSDVAGITSGAVMYRIDTDVYCNSYQASAIYEVSGNTIAATGETSNFAGYESRIQPGPETGTFWYLNSVTAGIFILLTTEIFRGGYVFAGILTEDVAADDPDVAAVYEGKFLITRDHIAGAYLVAAGSGGPYVSTTTATGVRHYWPFARLENREIIVAPHTLDQ